MGGSHEKYFSSNFPISYLPYLFRDECSRTWEQERTVDPIYVLQKTFIYKNKQQN